MAISPELSTWLTVFGHFMVLSLLAVGGALSVAPEMHRLMVGQLGLLTDSQFNASIAIAQAAPGPNVLFVAVMGYQAAGWNGAAATLLGIMLPSTTLAYAAARWGHARQHWRGVRAFKAGMAPITIALLLVTGWILMVDTPGVTHFAVTALAAILVWRTRVHMLWMILAGAAAGALGWV
jgi:chromate transporter